MVGLRTVASVMGAVAVAAAAYGAHGLEKIASPEQVRWWAIGAAIQLVTAPAVLVCAVSPDRMKARSGWLWTLGVVLFSGSLYTMALGGPRVLGAVTPIGGLALMAGWVTAVQAPAKSAGRDD